MKLLLRQRSTEIIASWFYTGYSPFAPGTAGTVGAVVPYILLFHRFDPLSYFILVVTITIAGIYVSTRISTESGKRDPSFVVVDEVAGFLLTMLFIPFAARYIITGFILFRVFDILKPFPARRLEKLPGGYGIVLDDIAAGVWSNILLHLISRYIY